MKSDWIKVVRNVAFGAAMTVMVSTQSLPMIPTIGNANANPIQAAEDQIIKLFKDNTASVVYINTYLQRLDAFSMNIMEVSTIFFFVFLY